MCFIFYFSGSKLLDYITLFTLVLLRPLGGVIFGCSWFLLLCFTLCPFVTKRGSNFYFWTGIVFLTGQVIFVPEWPKGELVSSWPHSVGQNHFFIMMLFNRDFTIQSASRKFCTVYKSINSVPCQPSGLRDIPSERSAVQSTICPDDMDFCQDAKVFIALFVRMTWIPIGTFLCVEKLRTARTCIRPDVSAARLDDPQCLTKASRFLSKTQIWEDRCNRPDALIHKASITIQIQTSRLQSALSGRPCIKYGNCVHQFNSPDDHPSSPDARSLYMEITYSGCATVWMIGQHRPDAAIK
jgi:hypothetical protein